jgi:hypothetical protein
MGLLVRAIVLVPEGAGPWRLGRVVVLVLGGGGAL